MAGILKFRKNKQKVRYLALPGEREWELWSFASPAESQLEKSLPLAELSDLPIDTRLALPTRQIVALPLWLQTTDPTLFTEMIGVQLEKRGLYKSDAHPAPYFHVVAKEEQRTLVLAVVLNPHLPAAYCLNQTGDYDYSARCRPLPPDGYVLWREEGRPVLALTRNGQFAYLHTFSSSVINIEMAQEILCLHLRLHWEKIIAQDTAQIYLCGSFVGEEKQALRDVLQIDPIAIPVPKPLYRENGLTLTPPGVTTSRIEQGKQKRWRELAGRIGWAYLAVVLAILGQFGWLTYQSYSLQQQIKDQTPTVEHLNQVSDHWRALQPAIDPKYYPMELLLACVNQLPTEARLTKFDQSPGKALITGETSDAGNAFKFLSSLQADPSLKKWSWIMPQPQILPNNRAQFQLEATHAPQ